MIALLVMTDGRRDCIVPTIRSAVANLQPFDAITEVWVHDDSGDTAYRAWLHAMLRDELERVPLVIGTAVGRSGFGGAIRSAWSHLREFSGARYIFHLEDDFTFNRPVHLNAMSEVLDRHPKIVQLALRRQPWNDHERAAGGVVELHPDSYTEQTCVSNLSPDLQLAWLEHQRFFTTNPSLYRRQLINLGWPKGVHSEGRFTMELRTSYPDCQFGYWGTRDSGEWVQHIGTERIGTGY